MHILAGTTQDRAGRKSYYDYDALKRPVRMQDAQGQTLQMHYDAAGNLVRLMDAKGYLTRWEYDASDRAVKKLYSGVSSGSEGYVYSQGLLSQSRGARGQVVSYAYDANANLTGINYPNMPDVAMSYNTLDDVTQIVDGVGTHSFSYDNKGKLLSLDGPFADDQQSFGYDSLQRLQSQSVGRGASGGTQSQSYAYDALGRLATLTSGGTQGVGAFTYNYQGVTDILTRLDLPNGTQTVQSYDGLQRLTQVVNQKNNGATLNAFTYAYDTRDVRTGVQQQYGSDPLRQVNYTYDSVDQLKNETATGGAANTSYSNAFDYDAMGNRLKSDTTQGTNSSSVRSSVNTLNQVTALSSALNGGPRVTSGFDYDAAGNTTKIENSDGSKTLFAYDDADRLVRIETRNAADAPLSKSEFVYDYASRKAVSREFTWTNGAWSQTDEKWRVFDGLDVIQERNAANQVTAQLVRDGNIGGILARSTQAGKTFFGYDGGGNVTLLTDANGDDVGRYRYDAFGNTLEAVGSRAAENPYRFSTKELHAQSGLYDFGYRFYSPGLGRWINRDPIAELGGVNLYAMVGNSPTNAVDSYGLYLESAIEIGSIGIGAVSFYGNLKDGRWGAALADGGGILLDGVALAIPGVPGGVGFGIKALRAAKTAKAAATVARVLKSIRRREALLTEYAKVCNKRHFDAVRRELWGEIVSQVKKGPRAGDPHKHIEEVRATMNGLRKVIRQSKGGLKDRSLDPELRAALTSQLRRAQKMLNQAEKAFASGP